MPAAPHAWSQEEILAAAVASLTEADIPPDEDDLDSWADPEGDRPDELADLMSPELEELIAEGPAPAPAFGPAGFLPRDGSGHGAGFADGGVLDGLAPGPPLAGFADDAHRRLADVDDDALIGVLHGWRRLASWAQARELATITELARRRPADGATPAPPGQLPARMSEFVADEVALALTLTSRAADAELGLALGLADRPATFAALEAGRIDLTRAKTIIEGVSTLDARHADAVEAAVLPRAPGLTTGQLGAAVARAVLAVDPQAARRRRKDAEKCARVDCWPEPYGTASLAGWHLPSAQALAADKRLCQIAAAWRKQGAAGETDLLRARAYLALLLGLPIDAPPADLLPPADPPVPGSTAPGSTGPASAARPGAGEAGLAWQPGSTGRAAPRRPRQRPAAAGRDGEPDRPANDPARPGPGPRAGRRVRATGRRHGPCPGLRRRRSPRHPLADHRYRPRWHRPRTRHRRSPLRGKQPQTRRPQARRPRARRHPARRPRARRHRGRRVDGRRDCRAGGHRIVRPPALRIRLPTEPRAAAADPDPLQHLHRARLPPPRHSLRPRPHPCLRRRRVDLRVQPGATVQTAPPCETGARMAADPAPAGGTDMDHAERTRVFHSADELSVLGAPGSNGARLRRDHR